MHYKRRPFEPDYNLLNLSEHTMADATLEELIADNVGDWVPSSTDLDAWVEVDPATDDTTVTLVGLFGADLTDFLDACATADDCDETDYDDFSGWAIGVEWTPAAAAAGRLR